MIKEIVRKQQLDEILKLSREIFIHNPDSGHPDYAFHCAERYLKTRDEYIKKINGAGR